MTSSDSQPSDLELAAREHAAKLRVDHPLASESELLVLAYMHGAVRGMDTIRAAHVTGAALAVAARKC